MENILYIIIAVIVLILVLKFAGKNHKSDFFHPVRRLCGLHAAWNRHAEIHIRLSDLFEHTASTPTFMIKM